MEKPAIDLDAMRHTLSHVLAAAVKELYPHAKFGIGPSVDDGFYYDIDFGKTKVTDTDLAKIEKKMHEIVAKNLPMTKRLSSKSDALNWARDNKQDYKIELIEELPEKEEISFYDLGNIFTDLCKGPHVKNTNDIGVFKQVSGVLLGTFTGYEKGELEMSVFDLLKMHITEDLTVAATKEIGHGHDAKAIVIGQYRGFQK